MNLNFTKKNLSTPETFPEIPTIQASQIENIMLESEDIANKVQDWLQQKGIKQGNPDDIIS